MLRRLPDTGQEIRIQRPFGIPTVAEVQQLKAGKGKPEEKMNKNRSTYSRLYRQLEEFERKAQLHDQHKEEFMRVKSLAENVYDRLVQLSDNAKGNGHRRRNIIQFPDFVRAYCTAQTLRGGLNERGYVIPYNEGLQKIYEIILEHEHKCHDVVETLFNERHYEI